MFYDNFIKYCKLKNVSPSAACVAVGLSNSIATKWKNSTNVIPETRTLEALANYFGVTIFDLLDEKEKPVTDNGDEQSDDLDKEIMYYARQLSPERKKFLLDQIKGAAQSEG